MNLNFVAPINEVSYGIVAANLVHEIVGQGHNLSLFTINPNPSTSPKLEASVRKALQNAQVFDFNAACIRLWHQNDMSIFAGRAKRVGFPIFELDRFTDVERHHLRNVDRLFVCSDWAKLVIEDNGIKTPVQIVPLGVDGEIFQSKPDISEKAIFLNVGKWEIRKGHDVIPDIFLKAFPTEDVELWMCNYNLHYTKEQNEKWEKYYKDKLGDRVRILPRLQSQYQIGQLMTMVDCGIFPSRAEGWNLEVLELMSCGKKSIVLAYSAITEFCNTKNSYLVTVDDLELAIDGVWFNGQGRWAKIGEKQEEQIIDYLRVIYREKKKGLSFVFKDCISTAKKYTWSNSAKILIDNLE